MMKSMTALGICAAAITLAMSAALAAPKPIDENLRIVLEPGEWEWTHTSMVGPAPVERTFRECISGDDASVSLKHVIDSLQTQCAMTDIKAVEKGYTFSLDCSGDVTGVARGRLSTGQTHLALIAHGSATAYGVSAPFDVKARADRIGACSAS